MAVGSLVTVAVLAFAALQGPKFFKGSAAASIPVQQTPVIEQQQQPQPTAVTDTPARSDIPSTPAVTQTQPLPVATPVAKPERSTRSVAQNTVATPPVQTQAQQPPPVQQQQTPRPFNSRLHQLSLPSIPRR